jgi:hypothetical protein
VLVRFWSFGNPNSLIHRGIFSEDLPWRSQHPHMMVEPNRKCHGIRHPHRRLACRIVTLAREVPWRKGPADLSVAWGTRVKRNWRDSGSDSDHYSRTTRDLAESSMAATRFVSTQGDAVSFGLSECVGYWTGSLLIDICDK